MFYIVKRTWRAGADPSEAPDLERSVGAVATREAGQARVEALSHALKAAVSFDTATGSWWAKAPDALYEFQVTDAPPAPRR